MSALLPLPIKRDHGRQLGCVSAPASWTAPALWRFRNTGLGQKRQRAGAVQNLAALTGGFTLIEVVIGAALASLILVSAYLCLSAAFSSQKIIEPRVDTIQNARVAAELLAADLRNACRLSPDAALLGMHRTLGQMVADNLDFATHNYTPRHPQEGDFCEISYYMDKDPETGQFGLWRRRNPRMALNPLSGGNQEEIATGLVGVRFEYFDGLDWYDSWGSADGLGRLGRQKAPSSQQSDQNMLPEAVRLTLLFNSDSASKPINPDVPLRRPPLVFQTVARLVLTQRPDANGPGQGSGMEMPGPSSLPSPTQ